MPSASYPSGKAVGYMNRLSCGRTTVATAPGLSAPERHALTFDGIVDRAYAAGVRPGTGTAYSVVTKLSTSNPNTAFGGITILSDPARTTAYRNCTDNLQSIATSSRHRHTGINAAGGNNYARDQASGAGAVGSHVQMAGRDLTSNLARVRIVQRDSTIIWSPADEAAAEDTQPLDLIIGAFTGYNFASPTLFTPISWVATVILNVIPSDAELQAYAAGTDARTVWGANVVYYVTATSLVGQGSGPIPALVGTPSLTLVGPVEADLVAYV